MTLWMHELRLLLRARLSVVALILLAILTAAAVTAGMVEIFRQRTAIAAIPAAQAEDIAAVADYVDRTKDQIKDSPELNEGSSWDDPVYRDDVGTYYGTSYSDRPGV